MRTSNCHKQPRGFTFIELLFVAGAAVTFAVVAVPALQDARMAERRTACKNRLKMIGIALHNYHDVYKSLPSAWFPGYLEPESRSWNGWQVGILPYVDMSSSYRGILST